MRNWLCLMLVSVAFFGSSGCGGDEKPPAADASVEQKRFSLAELQDPKTCMTCHPKHYKEWASSMHAYAAEDPVFLAMNKRGQRETQGEMGDFCVQCHAPIAVRQGLTKDGLNLDTVPAAAKGVTCYFCHNAVEAGPSHVNADVSLANDDIMRGNIRNAVDPGVHGVLRSESHNNLSMKSSLLCGSCHDVVNKKDAHIERTLAEYLTSTSSFDKVGNKGGDSCQGCHMKVVDTDYVAVPEYLTPEQTALLKKRDRHSHRFAAVDVALTDFPDREAQRHDTECALTFGAFYYEVLNDGQGNFTVSIETNAGHAQPSGTSQDRRLWLEFIAYDANDKVIFQSGVIGDTEVEEYPIGDPKHDAQLCMFRDRWVNEAGEDVHMFWEAATPKMSRPIPVATDSLRQHVANCDYRIPGRQQPARATLRMRMRPVGMDVLNSLVDSGDLDPAVINAMPTFTLQNTLVEWHPGDLPDRPNVLEMPITCP